MSDQNNLEAKRPDARCSKKSGTRAGQMQVTELMSEDCVNHGLSEDPAQPLVGASGFLPFHTQFVKPSPTSKFVVEDEVAEATRSSRVAQFAVSTKVTAWGLKRRGRLPSSTGLAWPGSKTESSSNHGTALTL
jgi:hypothetical protein